MTRSFFVPRMSRRIVPRPRLVERLDAAAAAPLIVVRGQAGMGKTVALSEWATHRSFPADLVWVTLDASAAGRYGFWLRVIEAMEDSGLPSDGPGFDTVVPTANTATALLPSLRQAFTRLRTPVVVVLDDYHNVRDRSVDDDLVWLLQQCPALSFVVGTRSASTLESAQTRAALDVSLVTGDMLSFSPPETAQVIAAHDLRLSEEQIDELTARVEGWPLATRVALLELEAAGTLPPVPASAAPAAEVAARLAREVLASLPATTVDFLLRTSPADYLTSQLASILAPDANADAEFGRLEDEGVGTRQRQGHVDAFRYHPLLRLGFEEEAERRFGDGMRAVRHDLAVWQNEHGHPMEAATQFARLREWAGVTGVLKKNWMHLPETYREELETILRSMSLHELRDQPLLMVELALLNYAADNRPMAAIGRLFTLGAALLRARTVQSRHPDRLWLLTAIMVSHRLTGKTAAAAQDAQDVMEQIGRLTPEDGDEAGPFLATAYNQSGTTLLHAGMDGHAILAFERALVFARMHRQWSIEAHATSLLALTYALRGEMNISAEWIARAESLVRPDRWQEAFVAVGYHLARALARLEEFDLAGAAGHLEGFAAHADTMEHWPFALRIEGLIALARGRGVDGLQGFKTVERRMRRRTANTPLRAMLSLTVADLSLAAGKPNWASEAIADADPAVVAPARARIELLGARPERALGAVETLTWSETPRRRAEAMLIKAVSAHRLGMPDLALRNARDALTLLAENGLRLPLMMVPRADLAALLDGMDGVDAVALLEGVPDVFVPAMIAAPLTRRERIVLEQLEGTSRTEDIARALSVSTSTVKSQLRSVYRKLGVSSREAALVAAYERGLLPPE